MIASPARKQPSYKQFYVAALLVIALIVVLGYVPVIGLTAATADFADTINMAGRQRTLSQRIPLLAALAAGSADSLQRTNYLFEMTSMAALMRSNHDMMLSRSDISGLRDLFYSEPYFTDARLTAFIDSATVLGRNTEQVTDAAALGLASEAQQLVASLDAVVNRLQSMHEQIVGNIETIGLIGLVVTLLSLLAVGLFIFRPMARLVKENERVLSQQSLFLNAVLSRVPSMIYVLNAQTGAITYLNPSLAALLGISSEPPPEGVSRDATLVIHPDDVERFNDLRAAMLKASDEDVVPMEARVRDAQGNFRLLGSNNTVFRRDTKGEVLEFLGIAKDVTDARAAARKAELMRQQSERVSLLNGFLSDTSHELRTPLTVINNSSYLITRVQDADERRKHSGIISEQVKRINNIIDQMQEVIRLTTLTQLETTSVRINDRIEAAIDAVPALRDKQIVLRRSLDETAPVIQGDGARLQKAVMCVLDNAARFTPPGGAITVSSRVMQENGRDVVAIEIRDSGPGIPEEDLPKIFDQFFKGNRARTPDGSGAGLGLTMARQIMNLHDGQIRAASPEGSGAQFTLIVPR